MSNQWGGRDWEGLSEEQSQEHCDGVGSGAGPRAEGWVESEGNWVSEAGIQG